MKIKLTLLCLAVSIPVAMADQEQENRRLTLEDLRTFTDVFDQVRNHFVEPRDEHSLLMAAIEGMVSTLDPWSEFMTPDEFREFDNTASGRYGGIGVNIGVRNRRLVVEHVNPLGPAFRNGVKEGDLILAVDDIPVRGRQLSESMDALLGEAGSVVRVTVVTPGEQARQLEFERENLDVASVFSAIREGVGLVRISHFTRQSDEELQKVLKYLVEDNGGDLQGLVIDLRANPGGVIQSAVSMADGFLDDGLIVYTNSRYQPSRLEVHAEKGQWSPQTPVAVLVDHNTASAAEVLAGALKDRGRAVVIGEKTYGKGSIQSILNMRNGAALKITTAHYYTPSGATIHERGIEPDITLEMSLMQAPGSLQAPGEDPVIGKAIEILKEG